MENLPPLDDREIEELCDTFRDQWIREPATRLTEYLTQLPEANRMQFLVLSIQAMMSCAAERNTREFTSDSWNDDDCRVDTRFDLMLVRYPELRKCERSCIELALFEYALWRNTPKRFEVEHYLELLPEYSKKLQARLNQVEQSLITHSLQPDKYGYTPPDHSTVPESASEPIAAWRLPKQLGHFQLLTHLGTGGMGMVFRALDLRTGAICAVKVMRRTDPWSVYRFNEEFRALATLNHNNLVRLFESYSEDNIRYFSMEYVGGRPLHRWWHRSKTSKGNWKHLCSVLLQIATGIQFLHHRGLLHGDIKCGNILVSYRQRAVLLDFGLVTFIENLPTTQRRQGGNRLVGTLCYLAPEVIAGEDPTPMSDWYSFGAMIHELITGDPPSLNASNPDRPSKKGDLPGSDELLARAGAPSLLSDLCRKLIATDPKQRPDGQWICRLLHELTDPSQPQRPQFEKVSFTGRTNFLRTFQAEVDDSSEQEGKLIVLCADEGVGLSRFLREWIPDSKRFCLQVTCNRKDANPYPIINALVQSFVNQAWQLQDLSPEDLGLLKIIAYHFPQASNLLREDAKLEPSKKPIIGESLAAFTTLIKGISRKRRMLIVVDDILLGDPLSLEVLAELWNDQPYAGVFVLGQSARHSGQQAECQRIVETLCKKAPDRKPTWMDLPELSEEDSILLAEEILTCPGMPVQFEVDLGKILGRVCRGNPQVLFDFVGAIWEEDPSGVTWPERIARTEGSDILQLRFERLQNEAKQLLQLLAVTTTPVTFQQIQTASRVGPEALFPHLGSLASQGWIRWTGIWPDISLQLANAADSEKILSWTDPERLRRRHWRLARALAREFPPNWFAIAVQYLGAKKDAHALQAFLEAAHDAALAANASQFEKCAEHIVAIGSLSATQQKYFDESRDKINKRVSAS